MGLSCPEVLNLTNCTISASYIRPDSGDSFIPWIYSVILLLVHIPAVILRVVKFESSQLLTILLAIYSVALTSLEYRSTNFEPSKIYVWTPIALTIDVGAMMQFISFLLHKMKQKSRNSRGRSQYPRHWPDQASDTGSYVPLTGSPRRPSEQYHNGNADDEPSYTFCFCVLLVSVALLVGLFALQIFGMVKAFFGYAYRRDEQFQTPWCSPAFQIGTKIFDRDGSTYVIDDRSSMGIGCVDLPGNMATWLLATGMIVAVELIGQLIDAAVLIWVQSSKEIHGVRMRRPWITMLMGLAIWGVLIGAGITQTQKQPFVTGPHIGMVTSNGNCTCALYPGGLRSSIIAWSDGVF